jgi:C_GCAxxG_C_C family probable redox protein
MGRMSQTCGAVTGVFMVLGLKFGNPDAQDKEAKERMCGIVSEFARRFEKRNGSIICKDLLVCDISKPEGAAAARKNGLFTSVFPKMVRDAAKILEGMLNE